MVIYGSLLHNDCAPKKAKTMANFILQMSQISVRINEARPYRLTVRTPGFHPGNPGSIPGKVTKETTSPFWWGVFFDASLHKTLILSEIQTNAHA